MRTLASCAMLALVFLFAGMFMALMLFASKASWIMEGIPVSPDKSNLLKWLCFFFLLAATLLTTFVVKSFRTS